MGVATFSAAMVMLTDVGPSPALARAQDDKFELEA